MSDSPRVPPCPYCGSQAVRVVSGLQSSTEIFLLILLAILFFPAALVYYLWLRSMPYCLTKLQASRFEEVVAGAMMNKYLILRPNSWQERTALRAAAQAPNRCAD